MSRPIAAIVLHWRSLEETAGALESALAGSRPADLLVVVDHRGLDEDARAIEARFPGATLLRPGTNLGFAGGNNAGLREAFARGASRALLLNDDARLEPEALARLEGALDADPAAGMAGPLITFADGATVWSAGGRIDWKRGVTVHEGERRPASSIPCGPPRAMDYLSGCALVVGRELVERIGDLDESYFLYFEEADWCERARRAGFHLLFVPAARAIHRVGAGDTYAANPAKTYYFTRNRLRFMRRYRPGGLGGRFPVYFAGYLARRIAGIARRGGPRRAASLRALAAALADYARGRAGPRRGL